MTDYLNRALRQDEEEPEQEEWENLEPLQTVLPLSESPVAQPLTEPSPAPARAAVSDSAPQGKQQMAITESNNTYRIQDSLSAPHPSADRVTATRVAPDPAGNALTNWRLSRPEVSGFLAALRRIDAGVAFSRQERKTVSVPLPDAPAPAGTLSADELDRLVERDARRYGGGFELY